MFAVKRKGRFLCYFIFRGGFDYRSKHEMSAFAEIKIGTFQECKSLAKEYDGKVVSI